MNGLDVTLVVFICVGAYNGYRQGFLMSLFSLLALILGVLGAFKLLGWAVVWLSAEFDIHESILPYVAFALVFIGIVILVRVLGRILKFSIDLTFLGTLDQWAGAVLGLLKTVFFLSVLIWVATSLRVSFPEKWTENSWLFPQISAFAPRLTAWISEIFPVFRDLF